MSYLKTKILVVEDNLQDFLIFKEVLGQIRDFFIQIEHASTLEEAVIKLEEHRFDIIFLDLFLPDSFGQDTFQKIQRSVSAPIVILSGLSDKNIALEIVKEGAQDYIVKGEFDANLLEKAIIYSIERKKYQGRIEQQSKAMENIAKATSVLLQSGTIKKRLDTALALAGRALNADRMAAYVFQFDEESDRLFDLVGYWSAKRDLTFESQRGSLATYGLLDIVNSLEAGKPVKMSHRESSDTIRKYLELHQVEHVVIAPMIVGESTTGVVILGGEQRIEAEEYLLSAMKTLAGGIGSAIATNEAEAELRLMNEELEERVNDRTFKMQQAMNELESFSYSVSHDLRAPLRAISGFSGALRDDYSSQLDETGRYYLGIIEKGATEMSQLIDDLLDFSRIGRKDLKFLEIDMSALVNSIAEDLLAQVPDRKIQFTVHDLLPCKGDETVIRQVLVNFIWNAIKFTSKRELAHIEVSAVEDGDMIAYTVKDNGVGFNMAYASKLFGVFQRLHPHEDFEGTGVGLAIVQRVVNRHGGTVTAEGEENVGAMFTFTLPSLKKKIDSALLRSGELDVKL